MGVGATGMLLGRWVLEETLGKGGFAEVWRARDPRTGEVAALKVAADVAYVAHLREERAIRAALDHPAIVRTTEIDLESDPPFVALELMTGGSLRERVSRARLAPGEALALLRPVASALEHAHRLGIFHLDVKPENVLLDAKGRPKLADFGLAVRTRGALAVSEDLGSRSAGTHDYAAPEVRLGDKAVGAPADVYGLAVLAFELLTGAPPIGLDRPSALVPGVFSPAADEVFARALARDPARRTPTPTAFLDDLGAALASGPRRETRAARRFAVLGIAALGLLSLGAVLADHREPSPRRDEVAVGGLGRRLADKVGRERLAVLPVEDPSGVGATPRARRIASVLAAGASAPVVSASVVVLHDLAAASSLARTTPLNALLHATIDPFDGTVHACAVDARRLAVLAVASERPVEPALEQLARQVVAAAGGEKAKTLLLLPTRDDGTRVSNLGTVAIDVRLATALTLAGASLRPRAGVLELLRAHALEQDRSLAAAGVAALRGTFRADVAVAALYDAPHDRLRADVVDLGDGKVLASLDVPFSLEGYASSLGAERFTVDESRLAAFDEPRVALEVAGVARQAAVLLGRDDPRDLASATAILESARARGGAFARSPEILMLLGEALRRAGRSDEQLALCEEALRHAPSDAGVHHEYARALLDEAHRLTTKGTRPWYWPNDRKLLERARELAKKALDHATTPEQRDAARELSTP